MARKRPGKAEREARKRRRRAWVVWEGNGGGLHADFRYFLRYARAESQPLKLGRKHLVREWRHRNRWLIAEKPGARTC